MISKVRGAIAPCWRMSWYIRGSVSVPSPDSSRSRPWVSPVVIDNDFAVWRSFDNHFGRGGVETNKANDCADGKCDSGATSEIAAHVGAKCQAADSQRHVP